jgi:hypothetical protein
MGSERRWSSMSSGSTRPEGEPADAVLGKEAPGFDDSSWEAADHIDIDAPGRLDALLLVRLAAGFVGARTDLGLEEVDDLRLAVDELCLLLLRGAGDDDCRLHVRYAWDDELIEITCQLAPEEPHNSERGNLDVATHDSGLSMLPDELSRQILDSLVDGHGVSADGGNPIGWIRKHRGDGRRGT